ncbi:hypothetical protein CWE09_12510 [Aliidiomarina minuta]|uniref:NADPH--hemoprotein reductase n=1 Tax=Aliidiomarina minuta TaxID=880057 RepID=A0A432W3L8_9GAMM|nr:sulfite reductase subunit alpha [Aliidiomarina minuta]RUO23965.1 hypothetical protein CWE09_12510 [Aliidiomarina minuta]
MDSQVIAGVLISLWAVTSFWLLRRPQQALSKRLSDALQVATSSDNSHKEPLLIGWASQSGQAQLLAEQAAAQLSAHFQIRLQELDAIDEQQLKDVQQALFIVSTYGVGEPPDNGQKFKRRFISSASKLRLPHLKYAVLALGDKSYPDYCAFGEELYAGLQRLQGNPIRSIIKVDRMHRSDLELWSQLLQQQFNIELQDSHDFTDWRLIHRECINEGSPGAPLFHLGLHPLNGQLPEWRAGDLIDIRLPDGDLRTYSIASVVQDERLDLVVRQMLLPDGRLGKGSGWLTERADGGSQVKLRIRPNPAFSSVPVKTPLILIGNGSGMAGLRALLRERSHLPGSRQWLIFGERDPSCDRIFCAETRSMQSCGQLLCEDRAFSRDPKRPRYVQDILHEQAPRLRSWLMAGAAVYVCGCKNGMGQAVDEALREIVGNHVISIMQEQNRYLRDLY